ncbi:response regulator [Bdellovibrio sp. SKB1291214]|uniref:response regulator n=1 Tax=Bdellovibrio sp. SKB1291214 TaxID=1732569 RepID=UPI000B515E52|nr:response regulator [Bdellovibrio sp. SKB1291214]UYL07370.1 response regulator [Bdellovibrio sp. SKB1291214]
MDKTKILIVDDNPDNIFALSELIKADDIELITANKPEQALSLLLDHDFALALLDVQMPEMSGFELAQFIRGIQKTRHLPIIFVTAQQQDQNIIFKGYESGAVDLMFKPLDPYIVRSKVQTFISLDRQNKLLKAKMDEVEFLRKRAEQANLSKSQFLANMSHEIRTPLASVLGFSDVLVQEDLGEEEKQDSLAAIRRNGELLLRLIDDILDLSKIEANQLHFMKSAFNFDDLLKDLSSTMSHRATDKGIALEIESNHRSGLYYNSDVERIKQVLLNLIGNAIKFTAQGSVKVHCSVQPDRNHHDRVIFEIRDTGIGISEEEAKKLFQPFSQADVSTRKRFGGTGLGLVISRELARSMGGDLKLISSVPGEGSFFEVSLLLEKAQGTTATIEQRAEALSKDVDLKGARILVVDDVSDNRLLIDRYMRNTHSEILQAANGMEAIEMMEDEDPDLILMDIQMPIMDGYETVRRIRAAGFTKPIIALTAHAMKEEGQKCMDAGCDGVLTKPARRKELLGKIQDVLDLQ